MTDERDLCPDCQVGQLTEEVYSEQIRYRDQLLLVEGLKCWVCNHCEAEIIRADQLRDGDKLIAEAKRRVDGLLSGEEIRAARKALRLTQKQASELFGGGQNAFSKYERGDVIQSVAMDRLVRLASEDAFVFRKLQELAGVVTSREQIERREINLTAHARNDLPPAHRPRGNVVVGPWGSPQRNIAA